MKKLVKASKGGIIQFRQFKKMKASEKICEFQNVGCLIESLIRLQTACYTIFVVQMLNSVEHVHHLQGKVLASLYKPYALMSTAGKV